MKRTRKKLVAELSNHQLVVVAAYLVGADCKYADTEDIAVKCNSLAPGRFAWRKYRDQINIEAVRKRLWDAKRPSSGALLIGSEMEGWQLTPSGLRFAKRASARFTHSVGKERLSLAEKRWIANERRRLLASSVVERFNENRAPVTVREAESVFRIDEYVTGRARQRKIITLVNVFGDDPSLGKAVVGLSKLVRKRESV